MRRIAQSIGLALLLVVLTARPAALPARALGPPPACEAPRYHGLRHCVHEIGGALVHVLVVDLANPYVSFHVALPARETSGPEECDSTLHCGPGPYPFETVPDMLARRAAAGAVVGLNTDYFGLSRRPDHGAEGVAVRAGVRLDDGADPGLVGRTSLSISRGNRARLLWVGARNTPLDLAWRDFNVAGGGPQIVVQGRPLDNQACLAERLAEAACARPYQSAAGLWDAGRGLVLAVARNLDSAGLARFLVDEYQVREALKFDGGGSAQFAWLDAQGQVAGFDASGPEGGGFRRVAQALLVYSQPLPIIPAGVMAGLILDDSAAAFQPHGPASAWHTAVGGRSVGESFRWTRNNTWTALAAGEWSLAPSGPGVFEVYAFIPAGHATTRAARYEVRHRDGLSRVTLDQWANRGRWALLGAFALRGDEAEYVRLESATGEAHAAAQVAFDALGLVRVGD